MAGLKIQKSGSSMENEIRQQPEILKSILKNYLAPDGFIILNAPTKVDKIVLVASGSSYHCARFSAEVFGVIAEIEARAIYSSEFLLKKIVPNDKDVLYIFITQSGETTDTLSALNKAKQLGVKTMCITNKENSTAWVTADYRINCQAGEEKSIASTKALTAQMLCLYMLALKFAQLKKIDVKDRLNELKNLPEIIEETLALTDKIKPFARFLSKYTNIIITADGISYALAKEACLKIKETSYINVMSHILGEFMHGHVAVLNNKRTVLVYVSSEELSYSTIKNLEKIKRDYNPPICVIGTSNDKINSTFNVDLEVKDGILKLFSNIVISQILALKIAEKLNRNVDKPKGLKKIVTEV
ncbi:MAG: SIS domain-containing protein [Candidatus Gastranaerophilales bacterium]|nr:SIS domain-containing protein [Candidatus Gastranaerophilales bacterium]